MPICTLTMVYLFIFLFIFFFLPYNFDPDIKGHIQYNGHQEGRQMVHFKNEGMVYHKGAQTKIFRKTYTNLRVSIEVAGPDQTRKLPNKINFCEKKRNGHTDFDNANKIKKTRAK